MLIEEKFKTQAELAKAVGRAQSSVSGWISKENFATTPAVRKNLEKLKQHGVNPEYLWNPLVEDWRMLIVYEVDEMTMYRLKTQLAAVKKERDELIVRVARLEEKLKKKE